MWGAIVGDLAGSIYEFGQIEKVSKVKVTNLVENDAFYSDDTILSIAIADAILHQDDYGKKLKEYATKYENYRPDVNEYFEKPFSPSFLKWAKGVFEGKSSGNGAMMRIAAVGNLFESEEEVVKNARLATIPSHNTSDAIECATKVALIIFYARHGLSKQEIIEKLDIKIKKPHIEKFNYTCGETIDLCLYSLFTTDNFEDALKLAISFGGDTDTNACIVGSMAEAFYGIDENLKQKVKAKLPVEFVEILNEYDAKVCSQKGVKNEDQDRKSRI